MIQSSYALHAVQIGSTVIGQITDGSVSDSITEFLARDSGSPYNRAAGVDLEDVRATFTTEAVKTALGAAPLTGTDIGTGANDVHLYFKKRADGGTFETNASITITFTAGLVLWRSLAAGGDGLASATFEIIALSADGDNDPYTTATAQTDAACTTEEMYVVTAADLGLIGFEIDTGIVATPLRSDGEPWFTHVAIDAIQPVISHRYHTLSDLGIGSCGSLAITDVASGGFRAANPITFTFNEELTTVRSIGGAPAVEERVTTAVYDGTNAPIVITGL